MSRWGAVQGKSVASRAAKLRPSRDGLSRAHGGNRDHQLKAGETDRAKRGVHGIAEDEDVPLRGRQGPTILKTGNGLLSQLDDGDSRISAIEIRIAAHGWVALRKVSAFQCIRGKAFAGDHEARRALLNAQAQGPPNGGPNASSFAARTPAMDHFENANALLLRGVHFREQPAPRLFHGR